MSTTEEQLKQIQKLWNQENMNSDSNSSKDKPPFMVFNPSMYSEQYFEKLKILQKKKEKKERKLQKQESRNVKSTFTTENDEDYDIENVLKSLGEMPKKANKKNKISKKN